MRPSSIIGFPQRLRPRRNTRGPLRQRFQIITRMTTSVLLLRRHRHLRLPLQRRTLIRPIRHPLVTSHMTVTTDRRFFRRLLLATHIFTLRLTTIRRQLRHQVSMARRHASQFFLRTHQRRHDQQTLTTSRRITLRGRQGTPSMITKLIQLP